MDKPKKPSIDIYGLTALQQQQSQPLATPRDLYEDFALYDMAHTVIDPTTFLSGPYKNAEGYAFSWGTILERRAGQHIVFEYLLIPLLRQYHLKGHRLSDLQAHSFAALESRVQCTSRDLVEVMRLDHDWLFCLYTGIAAFSQIIHVTAETRARDWIAGELIDQHLPQIIDASLEQLDASL